MTSNNYHISLCQVIEFQKPSIISTGIGFLDHMIDQFYSHAQIGISIQVVVRNNDNDDHDDDKVTAATQNHHNSTEYINRHANDNQSDLLAVVGTAIGTELRSLLKIKSSQSHSRSQNSSNISSSIFSCPLDEALTTCIINEHSVEDKSIEGSLVTYTLPPYGIYPIKTGRTHIGALQTNAIEMFWKYLAISSGLMVQLTKIRGHNAHHIVESSFKAFARALRNFLDDVNTIVSPNETNNSINNNALLKMYGNDSYNGRTSIDLGRQGLILRKTKETSIRTDLHLDGGTNGVQIDTGIEILNQFLTTMASNANLSLNVKCTGDLYIDEHHTAEDVAISIGQVINDALGDKAGLNRMWSCIEYTNSNSNSNSSSTYKILVVMDLSNRPCLTHNLSLVLEEMEMIGDLSCEMLEHVLESIVVNARMTVHIVIERTKQGVSIDDNNDIVDHNNIHDVFHSIVMTIGRAFGQALKFCSMVDHRRAGLTASSKGTLSV